ncbi:MAG: Ig-like domain-containing protein [Candidatus Thiodiazotropha endolucinida]|nr:Ig-like domain-containing protein [Candidatus Thiodiazotropha taylori]MCW4330459.1 Ig-like domain-containing protein [Candidatus Thiodiazotropha endolucinida]MCG8062439.1 Ig-like domain-containing protein [Candidatus Thiodiazotropha taylori]MCG8064373.1 Ig-like domain-containing protein [Candidatus Thiodiazotropha taylori]MCW4347093.1 Ig-like domain-containing protein [Candidatus Thiodiazotropha endolucinida]
MSGLARLLTALSLMLLLAACGGGDPDVPWDSSTTDTADGDTIDDAGTGGADIFIGSGSGASFSAGTLDIAVTSLAAGGQTTVSATLADSAGNLYQEAASVSFNTDCFSTGLATISTPVEANGGVVTATYVAQGCSGADTVRATVTVNGDTTTATGTINIQPAEIGSMEFISAEPSLIGLRGVGLTEVSRVSFRVLDQNGNPVTQQRINFRLSTDVGGARIAEGAETAVSDVNGLVGTDVKSGTIPTAVRVTASLDANPLISTQSDGLVISTGVSDQNSMSIATESRNPEAWEFDGVEIGITVHAADHFNNPVPDGASVYFTTEGGQIQSQCQIENGRCSVNWTSSNPRPEDNDVPGGMAGRITILATMLGEESFIDANGNGVLDNGDPAYANIPEAFRDDNEDGEKHPTYEEFVDFNTNGIYDNADSDLNYNGVLCCDTDAVTAAEAAVAAGEDPGVCYGVTPTTSPACSSEKNISVRARLFMIMAESTPSITLVDGSVAAGSSATFEIVGADTGQIMPAGTTVTASLEEGDIDDSYEVPDSNFNARIGLDKRGLDVFTFNIPTDGVGPLTILVTTPKGIAWRYDYPLN